MPRTGDVCRVFLHDDAPNKYAICFDPEDCLYLLINSRCYNRSTDLPVGPNEIRCLRGDSYLETAEVSIIRPDDVLETLENIGYELRMRICLAVQQHGGLPPRYMRPLLRNLCDIDLDAKGPRS